MEKMLISFSDPQAAWMRERAHELGISVSELVRRCIDQESERVEDRKRAHKASVTRGFTTTTPD